MYVTYAHKVFPFSGVVKRSIPQTAKAQFPNNTEQPCPFICFFYAGSDDFFADNSNYADITRLYIELYTDEKDFSLDDMIQATLKQNDLPYVRNEEYIDSERMWATIYEMEIVING